MLLMSPSQHSNNTACVSVCILERESRREGGGKRGVAKKKKQERGTEKRTGGGRKGKGNSTGKN